MRKVLTMMMRKICLLCVALLLAASFAICAGAEEIMLTAEAPAMESATVEGGISGAAALEGYINQVFGLKSGDRSNTQTRGSKLTGQDLIMYRELADMIRQLVEGNRTSTHFTVPMTTLLGNQVEYTAADLGVDSIIVYNDSGTASINPQAVQALNGKINVSASDVVNALLADMPYELYWFDKTFGYYYGLDGGGIGASWNSELQAYTLHFNANGYKVVMAVASEYAPAEPEIERAEFSDGSTKDYVIEYDASVTQTITTAANNAKAIVNANKGKSDYGKLKAYKEAICNLVEYNDDAATNNSTPYGNPWQLIWVFDNDPSTKVVCEGYSKAFKYLCDESSFNGQLYVSLASGTMQGGDGTEGAGRHMWNIVV